VDSTKGKKEKLTPNKLSKPPRGVFIFTRLSDQEPGGEKERKKERGWGICLGLP